MPELPEVVGVHHIITLSQI